MNEKKLAVQWQRDTSDVINDSLLYLAEGLTGIAASDRKELVFSVGHIFQSLRKGRFLSQFLHEWKLYRDKGKVKDEYLESEQHFECLSELLDFLDNNIPDERRFSVLKKIFLTAATEKITEKDSLLPQQYMKICKTLSSGEIIVLNTTYTRCKIIKPDDNTSTSAEHWLNSIASESKLKHKELVVIHEENLMQKQLLTPRHHSDQSGVSVKPYYRLTNLGYEICKYIENYESPE
nr:hypothetical protein [Bacteroidota bacterium]